MSQAFPVLPLSDDQLALLTAQLLIYQRYLHDKVAPSPTRTRALRVLSALTSRLSTLVTRREPQRTLFLTVEEIPLSKEGLTTLQHVLEARPASAGRNQEIQHLSTMRTLIEQTFPLTQG